MIAIHLDPQDEVLLAELAAKRGETTDQAAKSLLLNGLYFAFWPKDSEEDWAKSCESMMAKSLPPEDWSDFIDPANDP